MKMKDIKKENPLVCVRCMTYNHENFIEDTLNGFIMQKTDFRFTVVVIDDASTDNNVSVIRKYITTNCGSNFSEITEEYGNIIQAQALNNSNCDFYVILLKENHYGKKSKRPYYVHIENIAKFDAICEGDDYWTDPYKLQKQIDILEADESLVACFTDCMMVDKEGNVLQEKRPTVKRENAGRYNLREFLEDNHTSTLSLVYRNIHREELRRNHERLKNKYMGDWQLYICLLIYGDMYYLNQVTCAYRVNPASLTNAVWPKERVGRIKADRIVYKGVAKILPPQYADIAADFRDIRWTWVPLMFAYKAEKRYWGMIGCFIVSCFVCPRKLLSAFKEGLKKKM